MHAAYDRGLVTPRTRHVDTELEAAESAREGVSDPAVIDAAVEERYGATTLAETPRARSQRRDR